MKITLNWYGNRATARAIKCLEASSLNELYLQMPAKAYAGVMVVKAARVLELIDSKSCVDVLHALEELGDICAYAMMLTDKVERRIQEKLAKKLPTKEGDAFD